MCSYRVSCSCIYRFVITCPDEIQKIRCPVSGFIKITVPDIHSRGLYQIELLELSKGRTEVRGWGEHVPPLGQITCDESMWTDLIHVY